MKNGTKILCVLLSLIMVLSVSIVIPNGISAATIQAPIEASNCVHKKTYTIKQNYIDYGDKGGYDIVTYCHDCGQELSREYKEVPIFSDKAIYFDATSVGWDNTNYVSFYIYEIDGEELLPWGSTLIRGKKGENDIWYYNTWKLDLSEGKDYYIIFSDDRGAQTFPLLFNTSCLGHTASCDGTTKPNPVDSIKTCFVAHWDIKGSWSGTTGDCTWTVEGTVLTISGNGKMGVKEYDYSSNQQSLWNSLGITEAVIGDGVTTISSFAFAECTELEKVTLGNAVFGIAKGAFYRCENLESIVLPDSVQIIADRAFSDCISLSSVNIPEAVTDIGEKAFYNCPSLKNVTVPDSATNIDTKAFGYYYNNEFGITMRVPGFRIYGSVNSEAHRYAKAFGFRFERAVAMTGDANGDYMVNVLDVTEIQHSLASMNTTTDEDLTKYADVDHNDMLDSVDAFIILRYSADIKTPYDEAIGQIQD
ncbi:leucine-rich repeat protein [Ruminococcus sp.]|uniref:leucine-rich repeat protein n=1 Tax=Ruminococcus sp. TaxID=41978 RepID=UPI003870AC63